MCKERTKDLDIDLDINVVLETINLRLPQISYSPLSIIEIQILKGIWRDYTYNQIALEKNYSCSYITNIVAPSLLKKLSCLIDQKVSKRNCKTLVQKFLMVWKEKPLFPSGVISLNSRYYIRRSDIENKIYAEIQKPGALVRITSPQEMGKTSVLLRLLDSANKSGYHTIYFNLQQLDEEVFSDVSTFLRCFCLNITHELGLDLKLDDYWDEDLGCKASCNLYFQNYLLKSIKSLLILALDEVNQVFENLKIAKEFFSLLRFWYEKAKTTLVWQKLRLVVTHSTEIYVPLQLKQSPFNVGLPIQLGSLSLEEMVELAKCYELSWIDGEKVNLLMTMVGGHPALAHLAIYYLSQEQITFEELLKTAPTSTGIYANHLNRHQEKLYEDSELASALNKVIVATEPILLEPLQAYKLNSMGLIKLSNNKAVISCQLYRDYFQQALKEMSNFSTSKDL
ncbi:MAG: AAA-like domain-containing protein [Trichodesmium sp. MAG_R03]|nr:AAA-like domain-containing protein [Trichodesmium sp. MAG_R03]